MRCKVVTVAQSEGRTAAQAIGIQGRFFVGSESHIC